MGLGSSSQVPDGGAEGFHVHGVRLGGGRLRGGREREGREGRRALRRGPASPPSPLRHRLWWLRETEPGTGEGAGLGAAGCLATHLCGLVFFFQRTATTAGEERPLRSR